MKKLHKLYIKITDDPEEIGFDAHLTILSTLLAILAFLVGVGINLVLPLGNYIIIASLIGLLLYSGLYYLSRFRKKYDLTKIIFVISLSIFMDLLWLANFGSTGPIIYIYIVAYTGFLFYLNGKQLLFFNIFFFINTVAMFVLEYFYPGILNAYPTEETRVIDVYSGLVIYLMIATLLMIYIKNGFTRQRDKALLSEKMKSSFLANMSHEIRTPLNSILGYNQILEKSLDDPKLKSYLSIIEENGMYLLQIIEDILDISKIEAGEVKLAKTNVNIKELFEDVHSMLVQHYSHFIHTKAVINFSIEPDDLCVYSDYHRVKQILINLLTNSMKYTPDGRIEFSCMIENNHILFKVKDTGLGISENYKSVIFDRFHKVEEDGMLYPGTGIGLSISKNLVELLDGKIWFESEKNVGSEFFFTIPIEKYRNS